MKLIHKILSGEATEEEKILFYKNIDEDNHLKKESLDAQNLWHLANSKDKKIPHRYKKEFFEEFWNTKSTSNSKQWVIGVMKYAAVIIIAALFGILINNFISNKNKYKALTYVYQSQKGSVSTIILPDSSKVWMNSDSKLEITNHKGKITAKLSGEAYFDIKHDENREFIVDVGLFKIKDLGTKFNVKAYPEDNIYRASLLEGDMDILSSENSNITNVNPGQGVVFDKTNNKYWVTNIDISIESAWTEGKFVFIDETLTQMCNELEKWYNVDFNIQDIDLANTKFTCVLKKTTTIEQVLKILRVTSDVNYDIVSSTTDKDIVIIN